MTKSEKNKNYIFKKNEQGLYRVCLFLTVPEKKLFKEYLGLDLGKRALAKATIEKVVARTVQPSVVHHTTRGEQ